MARSEFVNHLLEQLAPLGNVTARAMFGAHGLYQDGVFFAIVADDVLFLKTDALNQPEFESRGLRPFTYQREGRQLRLGYFEAPPDALEDPDALMEWVRSAIDAGLRARAGA